MSDNKTYTLSIAGFDPSAGAGILADIKTFESIGVYGLGICSAITYQNDVSFERVDWIKKEQIIEQFDVLSKRFKIAFVKIGLIEDLETLLYILNYLKSCNKEIKIVWDPILKASAGFDFHRSLDAEKLKATCKQLYLITPNREEIKQLVAGLSEEEGAKELSKQCAVLLKGGHADGEKSTDILFENASQHAYKSDRIDNGSKHGSGCVLSSAVTGYLAKGDTLNEACEKAKQYINEYLASSKTLLGFHYKAKTAYAD